MLARAYQLLRLMIATGQLILGTDKRNALFTVCEWEEDNGEEQRHVYYGLELLEVVPADRNAVSKVGGSEALGNLRERLFGWWSVVAKCWSGPRSGC